MDEDLDARLVFVVAAAFQVVDAQDRRRVGEQILFGQEVADLLGDHRCAPLAAADIDDKAKFALVVLDQLAGRCHAPEWRRGHAAHR